MSDFKCNKCKAEIDIADFELWTGNVWISVYECDNCKNEFV